MADPQQPETLCRICMGAGSRGLADALVQPCGCRGTAAWTHLSCLHEWRLHKARLLRDASSCEVCGQPYRVPAAAWRAFAATGGAHGGTELRWLAAWQRLRPVLATAAAAGWWAVRAFVKARHLMCWLGQAMLVTIEEEEVPMLGGLGACHDRLLFFADVSFRWLAVKLWLEYRELGDWRAVQRGRTWRAAVATAVACAAVAVTLALQRVYAVPWNAPGAPAKEPPSAGLAESLYRLAVMLAAIQATREPSWFHGVLGPLASPRIASRTNAGYVLMQHANAAALAEGRQAAVAGSVQALLEARPAALAAFEAAIAGS